MTKSLNKNHGGPLTDREFQYIYSKVPRLCVDVMVKSHKGVILTLRDIEPYKNFWHIPGGTVHYRETIIGAVERIAKKELGIRVSGIEMLGFIEYPSELKLRGWGWTVSLVIGCKLKSGKLDIGREARDLMYLKTLKDLPLDLVSEQKNFIKQKIRKNWLRAK